MVKLAFYKAHQGGWDDKLISWWTKGPYSHVEIVVGPDVDNLTMYSSYASDGGVRRTLHKYDPTVWEYVDIDLDFNVLFQIYQRTNGMKYDYLGMLGFILPFKDRENKWFCSEWVSNVLKCNGDKRFYTLEPSRISPNKLYKIVRDNND
jgi:hypothetical protein